ncbi:MAG: hypothetical protein K0S32_1338 [Bacteroidetes bacterium]|jgi:hypothetical protein|nr:hypothetical protein [Bacteroidota bacterium]
MNPPDLQNVNPQQNNPNNNFNQFGNGQQAVPNSVGVLVLGILSIVFCWCYGILSIIMGIIALVLAAQGERAYAENPQGYTVSSYKNLKGGKICAIVGLALGSIGIIIVIISIVVNGVAALNGFSRF